MTSSSPSSPPSVDPADETDAESVAPDPRSTLRRWAAGLLGLAAALAFVPSGLLVLLGFVLTPRPGNEVALGILKLVDFVGWFGIGGWLLVEWGRMRFRVVAPAAIAWAWAYVLLLLMTNVGFLNIGY